MGKQAEAGGVELFTLTDIQQATEVLAFEIQLAINGADREKEMRLRQSVRWSGTIHRQLQRLAREKVTP
jgi:hypothetical protein